MISQRGNPPLPPALWQSGVTLGGGQEVEDGRGQGVRVSSRIGVCDESPSVVEKGEHAGVQQGTDGGSVGRGSQGRVVQGVDEKHEASGTSGGSLVEADTMEVRIQHCGGKEHLEERGALAAATVLSDISRK